MAKSQVEMTSLTVNQKKCELDVDPTTPLLWVLREKLHLTGTKFGCGMALCGACTVHLNGEAVRSCVTPLSRAPRKGVVPVEELSPGSARPLRQPGITSELPPCARCAAARTMAAAVRLRSDYNLR